MTFEKLHQFFDSCPFPIFATEHEIEFIYGIDQQQTYKKKGRLQNWMDHCQTFNFLCFQNFYIIWFSNFCISIRITLYFNFYQLLGWSLFVPDYHSDSIFWYKNRNDQRQFKCTCFTRICKKRKSPNMWIDMQNTYTFKTNSFWYFYWKKHIENLKKGNSFSL